jgi:predicted amidophosphoribosyltransferase
MNVFDCPGCEKEVTDKDETCPNCGLLVNSDTDSFADLPPLNLDASSEE